MVFPEKPKMFSRLLGSESEMFSAKLFIHCFSGKKRENSSLL